MREKLRTIFFTLSFLALMTADCAHGSNGKLPDRPTKLTSAACDLNEQEISTQGQSICRYLCRDPDKTKLAVVYSSSGSSQCRTPITRTLKVVIK